MDMGRLEETRGEFMQRELKADWNFINGSLRSHLSRTSNCAQHCLQHALSDRNNAAFFQSCSEGPDSHEHDKFCPECAKSRLIYLELTLFVNTQLTDAISSKSDDRHRLKRMQEECEMNSEAMSEYSNHIIRSTANEFSRKSIVDAFEENDALATMDFSLKLLPITNVESQSQWFAKKGISFHCSHILTMRNSFYFQHTFGTILQECKQDSSSVSAFVDHFLRILKENGVKRVFFRSDNAACYHNASLMASIESICEEVGIQSGGYFFSEAQDGKGPADRQISHGKRKSKDFVNGGGDGSTAAEIVHGLIQPTLLKAFSFYEMDILSSKNGKSEMKGIKSYGTLKFENDGIRAWRHSDIGNGMLFKRNKLNRNSFNYVVRQEGGHLSGSAGFWGNLGSVLIEKNKEEEDEPNDDEIPQPNPALMNEKSLLFYCPEERCTAVYKTQLGLENHVMVGRHVIPKQAETVTDRALRVFTSAIEKNRVIFEKVPVNLKDLEKSSKEIDAGFALVVRERGTGLIDEVRQTIEEYFQERRSNGRRADAKEISKIIRNLKNDDTSYKYSLRDCPTQSQAQTVITRLLKAESEPGDAIDKVARKTVKTTGKRKSKKRNMSDSESDNEGGDPMSNTHRSTQKARKNTDGKRVLIDNPKTPKKTTSKRTRKNVAKVTMQSESEESDEDLEEYAYCDQFEEIMKSIHDEYDELFL